MVEAVLMMGGLGLFVGAGLAAASKIFYVYVDPLILAVDEVLPGANCGGCGKPGCSANAEAIVAGKAAPNSCVAAGPDVAEAIAAIMGVSVEAKEPDIARSGCYYGVQDADLKYIYDGLLDCRAAALLGGGMKVCSIGCLGLGTCARACPFGAIVMGPDNLPVVIEEKCTGCGTCERVCPKHIITLSSVTRRILREYTTEECTTPCQRTCPAGINIREYIRQITLGDYPAAVQVIKERNPFPTVIGRICPRPCENDCRRKYVDEPVAINFLKRYAADYELEQGVRTQPYKAPESGRRVAIVGGGVEGLSAAFFSARLGHDTRVVEATDKLGGLLRSAIADYRLPADILQWDIDGVLDMGVSVETGSALGRDFTVDSLLAEGYEAVFLATGGWDSRLARGAGSAVEQPIPGSYLLVDFMKAVSGDSSRVSCGSEVVIAGGGRLAIEAARACRQMGAKQVTLVFREMPIEAPAGEIDMDTLAQEGIRIRFSSGIGHFFGGDSRLTDLEIVDLVTGNREKVAAQSLILAAGRFPELVFLKTVAPEEATGETEEIEAPSTGPLRWEAIAPYKMPLGAEPPALFSPNDVLSDYSAAIKAIAAGRRGAASIHQLMYGIDLSFPEHVITPASILQNVDHVTKVEAGRRKIMPTRDPAERSRYQELEKGFSQEMASEEAGRCLQCGLICYERCEPAEPAGREEKSRELA